MSVSGNFNRERPCPGRVVIFLFFLGGGGSKSGRKKRLINATIEFDDKFFSV